MTSAVSYDDVLAIYGELGFPREVVTHWTLPQADVARLLEQFDPQRPLRILEVGTFVGLSTLLIAAYCDSRSRIHTVDPNFPLAVELSAMKTPLLDCDATMPQQELARRAAEALGLAERIVFHAGGFATSATFASARADSERTVPVIGPAVCATHGPFDVIFLDGLHYTATVRADLELAVAHLAPGGRIVLHDVIGRWGANVRRAAWRFVEDHPEFRFRHGRYMSIYDAIGTVERVTSNAQINPVATDVGQHPSLENPEFRDNLATVIVNHFGRRRAVILGIDKWNFDASLRRAGLSSSVVSAPDRSAVASDLVILIDAACEAMAGGCEEALAAATSDANTIVLLTTPPGEEFATPGARPMGWWARQLLARGFSLHDELRPDFEPTRFAYSTNTLFQTTSSLCCNLLVARRLPTVDREQVFGTLLIEKERRIEDLVVQGVYTDFLLRDTVQKWISAAEHYQRTLVELKELKDASMAEKQRQSGANSPIGSLERLRRWLA